MVTTEEGNLISTSCVICFAYVEVFRRDTPEIDL